MQAFIVKYILIAWNFLWPLIVKAFGYLVLAWNFVWPYIEKAWQFIINVFDFIKNILNQLLTFLGEEYAELQPIAWNYAQKNHLWAAIITIIIILIIIFWVWMFKVARKTETWRKSWQAVIILLGPIGALIYFSRKKYLDHKQLQHDKVMMSFFSPIAENRSKK